ncbi:hypothetical protein [Pseudomonas guariconensis]|uniref:hypothetical protein n=1 Tax=Pseudomonas guariconensis TaxID=1288410 RepID=UPI0039069A26
MDTDAVTSRVKDLHDAASTAVFRLYGYLGAGERLFANLQALAGVSTFVASPFEGSHDLFHVSVLDHRTSAPVQLRVTHLPCDDSARQLDELPATTPGLWVAILQATSSTNGPFDIVELTVEGKTLDLGLQVTRKTNQNCDENDPLSAPD